METKGARQRAAPHEPCSNAGHEAVEKKKTTNVKMKRGQCRRDVSPCISGQGSTITNERLKPIRQLTKETIPRMLTRVT